MASYLPLSVEGTFSVKCSEIVTTPFVFVQWDEANARQVILADVTAEPVAGILTHAVAVADDECQVFAQVGGFCQIRMERTTTIHYPLEPTTNGRAVTAGDAAVVNAIAMEAAGAANDIIDCQWLGYFYMADATIFHSGL